MVFVYSGGVYSLGAGAAVSGGAPVPPGTDLGIVTVTNATNGTLTNQAFSFGLPIAPGNAESNHSILVYDDDGSGGKGDLLGNFQATDYSSDMEGDVRHVVVSGILPSIAANGSRKLHLESGSGGVEGDAITAANIVSTDFETKVSFDIGGTTYAFSVRDALQASATFSKTGYMCVVRSSGPACSRFYVAGPPLDVSNNPHAGGDGLRVCAEVIAYKTDPEFVSGGNLITRVECDVWVENGDVERSSPSHYWYGYKIERSTSLSDDTLIATNYTDQYGLVTRYDYPRQTISATLTATGATTNGSKTGWTIASGSWDADIKGATIAAGDGRAVVTSRTSDTTVNVYVYIPFAATSFSSGDWTIEGIGHCYAVTMPPRRTVIGQTPGLAVAWGDVDDALNPSTRAPLAFLAASKLYLNSDYAYPSAHTMADMDLMRGGSGAVRPLTFLGGEGANMGRVETDIGGTGNRQDIGIVPKWAIDGLARHDVSGRRLIFENAQYFSTWSLVSPPRLSGSPPDAQLGNPVRADNGTRYKWNAAYSGGKLIARPSVAPKWWPYDDDAAHQPSCAYFAYLLSGDIFWTRSAQAVVGFTSFLKPDASYNGDGMEKTCYGVAVGSASAGTSGGNTQARQRAWALRDILHAAICTPDNASPLIVNAKSYYFARIGKNWVAAKRWGVDDVSRHPGVDGQPAWFTGSALPNSVDPSVTSIRIESPWQDWMNLCVWGHAWELGLMDANGHACQVWLTGSPVQASASEAYRDVLLSGYRFMIADNATFSAYPESFDEVYKRGCLIAPSENTTNEFEGGWRRVVNETVTIDNPSVGSGRTVTFTNAHFEDGDFYVGGYVQERGVKGLLKITEVTSSTVVKGDVIAEFSGAILGGVVWIPGYSPNDYGGEFVSFVGTSRADYAQKMVCGLRVAYDMGISQVAVDNLIDYTVNRDGYSEVNAQFSIAKRT